MTHIYNESDGYPLIGICAGLVRDGIPQRKFVEISRRISRLDKINAVFVIFALEDLNVRKRKMRGYLYVNVAGEVMWEEGTFPFPDAIFTKCGIPPKRLRDIEKVIGRKLFNTINYDKWEEWGILKASPVLKKHLPDTDRITSSVVIDKFLAKYKDVFLKPFNGSTSKGVIRAIYRKKSIDVVYTLDNSSHQKKFSTSEQLWNWVRSDISQENYLVQESIQTVKWNKQLTGIRLNMAKDGSGNWVQCFALGLRVLNGSHIAYRSGYDPAQIMIELDDLLMSIQTQGIRDANKLKKEISQLGLEICKFFDSTEHHVADIGIDLGIDIKGKLWIFEVNKRPHPFHRFPVYDSSLTAPLEYAIYLAKQKIGDY